MTQETYIRELEAHIEKMQKALDDAANWIRDVKTTLGVDSTAEVIPAIRILQGVQPLKIGEFTPIVESGVIVVPEP